MAMVYLFFQGSATLKPADVADMVSHRSKVGYGNIIV